MMLFKMRPAARAVLLAALVLAMLARTIAAIGALGAGNERPLLAFPLAVIFPAVLVLLLASMPPARSREGLLMRVGAAVQLLLVVLLPPVGLYLALGLPVVFLAVELFETRAPVAFREAVAGMLVA